ncbi:MAG: hypothetical protein Q9187_003983 [Circinaria calcarea]
MTISKEPSNQELLGSFEPCDFEPIRDERHSKFTAGTCQWITREWQFQRWNLQNNLPWILGRAESGKSFIAHYLCEHLEQENLIPMCFFFDSKSTDTKDLRSLRKFYHTILHQLLNQIPRADSNLRAKFFEIVRQRVQDEDLTPKCLKEAKRDVLAMVQPAFLVVDALDECTGTDPEVLKEWLEELKTSQKLQVGKASKTLLKILSTSIFS